MEQAGDLTGKIAIDATNPYNSAGLVALETSAAEHNQARMPGVRLVRSFNMFTAGFQKQVADGEYGPIAMFYVTESEDAKEIADSGFKPIYLGGWNVATTIEAPAGMLVGKSYLVDDAHAIVEAFERGDMVRAKGLADTKDLGR